MSWVEPTPAELEAVRLSVARDVCREMSVDWRFHGVRMYELAADLGEVLRSRPEWKDWADRQERERRLPTYVRDLSSGEPPSRC